MFNILIAEDDRELGRLFATVLEKTDTDVYGQKTEKKPLIYLIRNI